MISLKLAIKQVIRRPRQNLAVILGIALGVSLFVGVQVGTDSLNEGLYQSTVHSLGETDAQIQPRFTPFFVSEGILTEELTGNNTTPIIEYLRESGEHLQYIKNMAERLSIDVTALQPESGSIEVGESMVGVDTEEEGFGSLYSSNGTVLDIANLESDEIYIGEGLAENIFLDENPIGKNLTIQTTLTSQRYQPSPNITIPSIAVPLQLNLTIADVFVDQGLGRERFANFIIAPLDRMQQTVATAFDEAAVKQNTTVIGYGGRAISNIIIDWKDSIEIGDESKKATKALQQKFKEVVGEQFINLYNIQDTRRVVGESVDDQLNSLEDLLNIFGSIIILAGILVIINIQNMALAAREKETGILRAVGSNKRQIIMSNLLESMFLGIIGALFGLIGGIGYGRLLVFFLGTAFEFPTGDIPTVVTPETLISSFVAGFVISQVTGLIPAIRASRINVAQVLRGIDPPKFDTYGKKSLYSGIIFSLVGIAGVLSLQPNPVLEGKEAFRVLSDVENMYLPIAFAVVGPALLFAYYKSKKAGLTIAALWLQLWAYFNIFFIFDWIDEGSGGLLYILYLIMSLVAGSIILVAMNLGAIAAAGQKFASFLARNRETPIRGTTMVAFRKMRSNVTRSTLTFALFATILTMNIFIGTWSYSFRFGYDQLVVDLSGDSDILFFADNPVSESIDISQEMLDTFGEVSRDTYLTSMKGFTMTNGFYYQNLSGSEASTSLFSMKNDSLWSTNSKDNWIFKFNLLDNKTNTPFETSEDDPDMPAANEEDNRVWQALANNETIANEEGEHKPIIITSPIGDFSQTGGFNQQVYPGDSIYLNLTNGDVQEFVVGAIMTNNPLIDYNAPTEGPPTFGVNMMVADAWKDKLLDFSGLSDQENMFLGKTNEDDITSDEIPKLATEIEQWANSEEGEFRNDHGLYGIIGVSVYSIYEAQLEGQYRFFSFLQAFVSLGFAVGILGLLVVASRSVAERTREIGMLRALGFRRWDIVISVVLELVVMGLIGLILGFLNGTVLGYALTDINSGGEATFLIPWWLIGLYGFATTASAIIAAIFPAVRASKIPASDALRYTG